MSQIQVEIHGHESPYNERLGDFLRAVPTEGRLGFVEDRRSGFFSSAPLAGSAVKALVVHEHAQILGALAWTEFDTAFPDGMSRRVALLSGLRIIESARGRRTFLRGFRALKRLAASSGVDRIVAFVLEENSRVASMLLAGRQFGLEARCMGRYKTLLFSARTQKFGTQQGENAFTVRRGCGAGLDKIVSFLRKEGAKQAFFPFVRGDELFSGNLGFRGLSPDDFLLAYSGDEIAGCAVVWDQSPFRRWVIKRYQAMPAALRKLHNLSARLSGGISLPPEGGSMPYRYLSLFCVKDNNPAAGKAIVRHALERLQRAEPGCVLAVGLHESDRRLESLEGAAAKVLHSLMLEMPLIPVRPPQDQSIYFDIGFL